MFSLNTEDDFQNELIGFSDLHRPLWPAAFEHFLLCLHSGAGVHEAAILDFCLHEVVIIQAFLYILFYVLIRLDSVIPLI